MQRPITDTEVQELDQVITENTPGLLWTIEHIDSSTVKFASTDQRVELMYIAVEDLAQVIPGALSRFNGIFSATIYLPDAGGNLIPAMIATSGAFEQVFQLVRDQLDLIRVNSNA